jgi:hypothetical protein
MLLRNSTTASSRNAISATRRIFSQNLRRGIAQSAQSNFGGRLQGPWLNLELLARGARSHTQKLRQNFPWVRDIIRVLINYPNGTTFRRLTEELWAIREPKGLPMIRKFAKTDRSQTSRRFPARLETKTGRHAKERCQCDRVNALVDCSSGSIASVILRRTRPHVTAATATAFSFRQALCM